MYIDEMEIRVRYAETDQMGIVHHSVYYVWFEAGRTEWTEQLGLSYQGLEEKGLMLPLVSSSCNYLLPAKYPDYVTVKTWVSEVRTAKIIFDYEVFRKQDQKVLAKGQTVHGLVDRNMKIINVKKQFPDVYSSILALTQ